MSMHRSLNRFRWLTILMTFVLTAAVTQVGLRPSKALSASSFHIELTLMDPTSGGPITQNDALTLTVRVFDDGVRSKIGVVLVSSNTPVEKNLCEIHTLPYSRDYCQFRLPKSGLAHIVARLSTTKFAPWRFVASASVSVDVMAAVAAPS